MKNILVILSIFIFLGCSEEVTQGPRDFDFFEAHDVKSNKIIDEDILMASIEFRSSADLRFDFINNSGELSQHSISQKAHQFSNSKLIEMLTYNAYTNQVDIDVYAFESAFGSSYLTIKEGGDKALWRSLLKTMGGGDTLSINLQADLSVSTSVLELLEGISSFKIGLYMVRNNGEMKLLDSFDPIFKKYQGQVVESREASAFLREITANFSFSNTEKLRRFIKTENSLALKVIDIKYKKQNDILKSFKQMKEDSFKEEEFIQIQYENIRKLVPRNSRELKEILKNVDSSAEFEIRGDNLYVNRLFSKRSGNQFDGRWVYKNDLAGSFSVLVYLPHLVKDQYKESQNLETYRIEESVHFDEYLSQGEYVYVDLDILAEVYHQKEKLRHLRFNIDFDFFLRSSKTNNIVRWATTFHRAEQQGRTSIKESFVKIEKMKNDEAFLRFLKENISMSFNDEKVSDFKVSVNPFYGGAGVFFKAPSEGVLNFSFSYPEFPRFGQIRFLGCNFHMRLRSHGDFSIVTENPNKLFRSYNYYQNELEKPIRTGILTYQVYRN